MAGRNDLATLACRRTVAAKCRTDREKAGCSARLARITENAKPADAASTKAIHATLKLFKSRAPAAAICWTIVVKIYPEQVQVSLAESGGNGRSSPSMSRSPNPRRAEITSRAWLSTLSQAPACLSRNFKPDRGRLERRRVGTPRPAVLAGTASGKGARSSSTVTLCRAEQARGFPVPRSLSQSSLNSSPSAAPRHRRAEQTPAGGGVVGGVGQPGQPPQLVEKEGFDPVKNDRPRTVLLAPQLHRATYRDFSKVASSW